MAAAQDASSTTQAAQPAPQSSPTVQPQAQAASRRETDIEGRRGREAEVCPGLDSKTATDDDPVNQVLDEDLKVGDVTVVKAGESSQDRHATRLPSISVSRGSAAWACG